MKNVILPTDQPVLPTATRAITATPLPTETPIPTFTNTPLPGIEFPTLTLTEMSTTTPTVRKVISTENKSNVAAATIEAGENETKVQETEASKNQVESENAKERSLPSIFIYIGFAIIVLIIGFVFWRRGKRI